MSAFLENTQLNPTFPMMVYENDDTVVVCHHWHDEIEIVLVTEGELLVGVNNKEYHMEVGDILIIGSCDIHYFPLSVGSKRIIFQFDLKIYDDQSVVGNKKEYRKLIDEIESFSQNWSGDLRKRMCDSIMSIYNEFNSDRNDRRVAIKYKMYEILLMMHREIPKKSQATSDGQGIKQRAIIDRLDRIFEYVEENYEKEISLRHAAECFGFDVFYFAKFFKKSTGITFGSFVNDYRLTKAQWYLLNEGLSITEVCYRVGFQSVKTFNRQFKNLLGVSPSAYRKKTKYEKL